MKRDFILEALFQFYCKKDSFNILSINHVASVKFGEMGSFYVKNNLLGFKGGFCTLFELPNYYILVFNMHLSSKNI